MVTDGMMKSEAYFAKECHMLYDMFEECVCLRGPRATFVGLDRRVWR